VSQYQKGNNNLDFCEARDSEWQWHQLGRMQVCTSLQTDNHTSTPLLSFLQAGCPSCRTTNSVKALKAHEPRIKKKIGYILCQVHVWKWPVVKYKHIKIKPRICILFILCFTWTVNANSLKQNIIVLKEICSS